ncbi:MAG: phage repressor protein C with HTH and peptisase S24 domain [Arenicella sp.]|jgi:phage repressor protein C with HTH and peptisase S24 domain
MLLECGMALGTNVKIRREFLGITQKHLAESIGVSQEAIANLEKRDSQSSRRMVALSSALKIKPENLENGIALQSLSETASEEQGQYAVSLLDNKNTDNVSIPIYGHDFGIDQSSRDINKDGQINQFGTTNKWIEQNLKPATSIANICITTGRGSSMAPTILDGSAVFIDIGATSFSGDHVYLLKTDDNNPLIKRVVKLSTGNFMLANDNDHFPNEECTKIEIIGRVIGAMNFDQL